MKFRLLLLFFWFIYTASFAQRFGVDVGYAYSINNLKKIPSNDTRIQYIETKLEQKLFPNFSLGAYVRIYKRLSIYIGVDVMKFRFKERQYYGFIHYYSDYTLDYTVKEIHVSLLPRLNIFKFKNKHTLCIYGGILGRFLGVRKGKIYNMYNEKVELFPPITLEERKDRYRNCVIGMRQTFSLKNYMAAYVDVRFKYLNGYYYVPDDPMIIPMSLKVTNSFAVNLSLGVSVFLPNKKKDPSADPARLED